MPTPEIIDQAAFAAMLENLGGDVDFLCELLDEYLASSPELIAEIQQAISSGDAPVLQRSAHTLKSGSASFGALDFAAQCKELEFIGRSGELAGADEKARALESAYPGVVAALKDKVQSTRSA